MPFEILCTDANGTCFNSILLLLMEKGDHLSVISLLQDATSNPCQLTDSTGTTLLHRAARYGNKEILQYLVDLAQPHVDIANDLKETPLMHAVEGKQVEAALLLFRAGADIFLLDARGRSALGIALNEELNISNTIVKAFLEKVTVDSLSGSKYVESDAFHRYCPLSYFMSLNDPEITRVLLEKGSPVDGKTQATGETALHSAVEELNLDNVKLLLKWGADVDSKRYDGSMPIARIANFKDQSKVLAIVQTLIGAGATLVARADLTMDLPSASILTNGNREIVRAVLQCDIDWQFKDPGGETILHHLARNEHPDILEELRGFEFDINARSDDRKTMLHYAVLLGNANSVKFLVDHGADIEAQDYLNNTPLGTAIHPMRMYDRMDSQVLRNYLNCVELLVERGADCQIFTPENIQDYARFVQQPFQDGFMTLMDPVIAHLTIVADSGQIINQTTRNKIQSCPQFKSLYDSYEQQVGKAKSINIDESLTLLDFLTMSEEQISLYARNRRIVPDSDSIMKACCWNAYFERRLQKGLAKVTELVRLRVKLATTLNEIMKEFWDVSVYNVAENIVSMLEDQDLYKVV